MHQSRECAAAGTAIKMLILGGSQTLSIYYKVFLVAMLKGLKTFDYDHFGFNVVMAPCKSL